MKIIFLVSTFLFYTLNLFSQPASTTTRDGSSYDIATNSTLGMHNFGLSKPVDYDDVDGSPFFYDDFVHSSGVMVSGSILDSMQLKYDIATFSFIAKLKDDSEITVDAKQFREFSLNVEGEWILFKRVDPKFPNRFYEIIYTGKDVTIYKSEEVNMVQGEDQGITKTNDRFFTKKKYLIKKGREIKRVKLKKKDLWKYFDDKKREILDQYLKENNTKLKSDSDYRNLFRIITDQP